jgi:hypothetical protein
MLKWATILSTVMIGATMLSAIDAHAFRGSTFGHFTPVYRSPNLVLRPSFRGRHYVRVIPNKPPPCYGFGCRGPNIPICHTVYEPPGPCEVWSHGTPTGHPPWACVICN